MAKDAKLIGITAGPVEAIERMKPFLIGVFVSIAPFSVPTPSDYF